jgi:hypothetical protein
MHYKVFKFYCSGNQSRGVSFFKPHGQGLVTLSYCMGANYQRANLNPESTIIRLHLKYLLIQLKYACAYNKS